MWFKSSPCVKYPTTISSLSPFQSPVQHASGRMEVINKHSIFLTVGDLGFNNLFDREKRGDLGSVFRITKKVQLGLLELGYRKDTEICKEFYY